jgi:hypothetical protein
MRYKRDGCTNCLFDVRKHGAGELVTIIRNGKCKARHVGAVEMLDENRYIVQDGYFSQGVYSDRYHLINNKWSYLKSRLETSL